MDAPQIQYAKTSDGVRIAYATYGNDGLPPLVHMCHPAQEAVWASPWGRACLEALGRSLRLITLDPRGTGASQRDIGSITVESWVSDLIAVVDHLGVQRFALLSIYPYDVVGLTLAARYAERITRLVLWSPRVVQNVGRENAGRELGTSARANWSMYTRAASTAFFPGGPPEAQRWYSTSFRSTMSPEVLAQQAEWIYNLEQLLPRVTMRALVLHRKDAQRDRSAQARQVASLIPNARLVMLDGDVLTPYWDHEQFISVIEEFLGVEPGPAAVAAPQGTAIILFADIADSTALTEQLGDAAFRDKARALDEALRQAIGASGGTAIEGKLLGDGVLATFGAAREAIACAQEMHRLAAGAGGGRDPRPATLDPLSLHVGIHAGDVIREEGNVYGGAVNIAARVAGEAAAGETLVSATVRDLARTSAGVSFEDRGERELKGVSEPVRVFAVSHSAA